jgi:hypothetical protein
MDSFCSKIRSGEFAKFGNGRWSLKIEFKFFLSYINLMSIDNTTLGALEQVLMSVARSSVCLMAIP